MIEQIFHDEKKSCVGDQKLLNKMICSNLPCFVRKNRVFSPHDLTFQLIKKNYKAKFSTNLILKKKTNKDNFERKKTHEKKCCSN
jgi:hypothetical protein